MRFWQGFWVLIALTGCAPSCERKLEDLTPEEIVEAYLETSFNLSSVEQKGELLQFTTGKLRQTIAEIDDNTFRAAYVEKKYTNPGYRIIERLARTPREMEITFLLSYDEKVSPEASQSPSEQASMEDNPQVETENTVSLLREEGIWRIQEVLDKKTSIAFPQFTIRPRPVGQRTDPLEDAQTDEDDESPLEDDAESSE